MLRQDAVYVKLRTYNCKETYLNISKRYRDTKYKCTVREAEARHLQEADEQCERSGDGDSEGELIGECAALDLVNEALVRVRVGPRGHVWGRRFRHAF